MSKGFSARIVGYTRTEGFYELLYCFKVWLSFLILVLLLYVWAWVYLVVERFVGLFHTLDEGWHFPPWPA